MFRSYFLYLLLLFCFAAQNYAAISPCLPGMTEINDFRGRYIDCPIGTYQPYGGLDSIGKRNCVCLSCDQGYTTRNTKTIKKEDCISIEKSSIPSFEVEEESSTHPTILLLGSFFICFLVLFTLYIKLPSFKRFVETSYSYLFRSQSDDEVESLFPRERNGYQSI